MPQGLDPKNATCIAPSLANVTGWSRWAPSKYYDVRGIDWEDVQAIPGEHHYLHLIMTPDAWTEGGGAAPRP